MFCVLGFAARTFGTSNVALFYGGPYLWVNFWLVTITFLQHTHTDIPHYSEKEWNFVRGGLKEGFVKASAYGPTVSEAARKNADAVKAKMMAGGFDIFAGEMKDNTGKVVIPKGKIFKQTDLELEGMNYLVEGVLGKI